MTTIDTPANNDKFKKLFPQFCDSQAYLFSTGKKSLHDAVDSCQDYAVGYGLVEDLGQDEVQLIMARAFSRVRDDLGGWVVP